MIARLFVLWSIGLSSAFADDAFFERMCAVERAATQTPAADIAREVVRGIETDNAAAQDIAEQARNRRVLDMLNRLKDMPHFTANGGQSLSAAAPPKGERVLLLLTLAMPDTALKQWLAQARTANVPAIIRGAYGGSLKATRARLDMLSVESAAGVRIDPTVFKRLDVKAAPVVIALADALPQCVSRRCADEPVPPHDRVAGNIGLDAALDALAENGTVGRDAARTARDTLRARQATWGSQ